MGSSSMSMTAAIICLVILAARFFAAGIAFSSPHRIRIKNLAEDGNTRAPLVLSRLEDQDRLPSTVLIGNNIVSIITTTVGAVLLPPNGLFSLQKKLLNLIFKPSEDAGITEEELIIMVSEAENEGELDKGVEEFRRQKDGSYIISCAAGLADLYDLCSLMDDCAASTVFGWTLACLSLLSEVGDHFQAENLEVLITKADQHRVLEIQVSRRKEEALILKS